jgi:hypothetical protein
MYKYQLQQKRDLSQYPAMEEKIGSVHFFQERKAGKGKIIKILVSEEGNILSSENQEAKFIFE